nr:uncharacterized protein LOC119166124 [Rhipicephalus microplus]
MTTRPRRVDALLAEALESSGTRARGGNGAKNPSAGMQLLLRLRIMFAESAIPGLRVILGLSHPVRRLAWTAALAALVYVGLNDLYIVFREYFEYADTVDVMWARSPEGMALPAVTVCNVNQLREDNATQREEFHKWIAELQRRNETTAKLLGHQRENMVVSCLVGGKDCNTPEHLQVKVYGPYGNCFCLGCNLSAEREKIQTAYSPDQGVRLLLNLELNEYLPHTTEAGFVVSVHQPGVQVDFRDSIFLLPCHTTMISVTQSIYFRLEPPYRNPCQRGFPEKYREYIPQDRVYTRKACRQICAQLHVIAACGCQSHDYDTVDRSLSDICNEDDEELRYQSITGKEENSNVPKLVKGELTVIEHDTQVKDIENVPVELIPPRKTPDNIFVLNVYSSPRCRKHRFHVLFKRALDIAQEQQLFIGGDFNAVHTARGYKHDQPKGRHLWETAQLAGLELVTDIAAPTRQGNSVSTDTTLDLAFPCNKGKVTWRNTMQDLGSDHYIIFIEAEGGPQEHNAGRQMKITNWELLRQNRDKQQIEDRKDIEQWTDQLRRNIERATQMMPPTAGLDTYQ